MTVLFVDRNSNYKNYPGTDCYDEVRNALNHNGKEAVICHPPCRLFSKLKGLSKAPLKEKQLAYYALNKVRSNGGILEHPKGSDLFKNGNFDLSGKVDKYGGFLRSVDLTWFGFNCKKQTIIYFVGLSPKQLPAFPILQPGASSLIEKLHSLKRSETPVKMIEYFEEVYRIIEENKRFYL